MSLKDFGAVTKSPVRRAATDRNGMKICPECGRPVEGNKGTHELHIPETADPEYPANELPRTILVYGYVCNHHQTPPILPEPTNQNATNLPGGWTGIRLRFSDELTRYAPVIEKELDLASQRDGGGSQ